MNLIESMPSLQYAEVQEAYMPRPIDPRIEESIRIAQDINRLKVENPDEGNKIYDSLVDDLVTRTLAIPRLSERYREASDWSAPQRIVWRESHLPIEKKFAIVNDRSVLNLITTSVFLNHGKWLVSCPFTGCSGAQYASFLDRRFYCVDCESFNIGHQWIEIIWPNNILAIEKSLLIRPVESKNWIPGETIEDLEIQNLNKENK